MLKKLTSVAFLALALLSSASAAHAKPKVERAQLNIATSGRIIVVADDGENYSRLATQNLRFEGNVDVKMKSGKLLGYGIFFGVCADSLCGGSAFKRLHSNSFSKRKEIRENVSFELSTDQIPQGLSSNVQASSLFKVCQEKAQGQSVDTDISHFLKMTLTLDFKEKGTNIADWADDRDIQVRVICRALQQIKAPPKPYSVDVQVEQKGETCPKQTDVRAIIKYKVPATARFRFKADGKLSKVHEIKARKIEPYKPHPGPGKGGYYLVERLKTYHLDPGQTHFRVVMEDGSGKKSTVKTVRIDCPPFEVTSMWLTLKQENKPTCPKKVDVSIRIDANRPGSVLTKLKNQAGVVMALEGVEVKRKGMQYIGRYKTQFSMSAIDTMLIAEDANDTANNSGWVPLKVECMEVLSGTLDLRGFKASRCEGEAAFSIRTNMAGDVPYQLDCTGGRSWKGKVEAHQTGPNTYIGVGVKRFDASNNEQVNCALKTAKPLPYKVLALKGRNYECHKTTDVGGADGFVPETRPDPQGPRNLGKVIVIPPRVVVDPVRPDRGGERTDGTPDYGEPGGPDDIANPGPICLGGTVKYGKCLCDRTRKPVKTGRNAFRCVLIATVQPAGPDKGGKRTDATPDYPKKTRADAEADKKRLETLKRKQALEARKKAEAAKKAAEARRKREAAKKAAELRHKRATAKKAAELKRRREAAKRAAAAKKAAEMRRKRKAAPPRSNRSRSQRRR